MVYGLDLFVISPSRWRIQPILSVIILSCCRVRLVTIRWPLIPDLRDTLSQVIPSIEPLPRVMSPERYDPTCCLGTLRETVWRLLSIDAAGFAPNVASKINRKRPCVQYIRQRDNSGGSRNLCVMASPKLRMTGRC